MKPSSKRGTFCYFKGRTDYSFKRRGHIIPISADKPHVRDRLELIKLSNENKLGGCTASAYNPGLEHVGTTKQGVEHYDLYEKHVTSLADTVFSPCPAGNNPETFRHYESLELGAIPIVVRQKDNNDTDFLQYGAWKDYPGPVLDHWGQLKEYMSTANVEDVDALQQRVLDWYTAFKIDHKRILTEKLAKVFGKVRQEMERGAYKGRYSLTNRYVAAESVVNDAQVRAKLSKSLQKHTFTGDNRDEIVVNVEGNAKDRDNAILKSVLIKLISYEARLVKVEAELEAAKLREGVLLKVVEEHTKECSSQCKDMGIM